MIKISRLNDADSRVNTDIKTGLSSAGSDHSKAGKEAFLQCFDQAIPD